MTISKATGTKLFISTQKTETFDSEGFKELEWTEIGSVLSNNFDEVIEHTPLKTINTIKRRGRIEWVGRIPLIHKPKRARFGRIISFRRSIPFFV